MLDIVQTDHQSLTFLYARAADQDAPTPARHPVVVVGAGPVGLSAAIDLAQGGIPVVLLDDDDRLSSGSRAICFAKRTLEIFDRLGCGEAITRKALVGFRGGEPGSCYQDCDKGAEQGFAASARVVHELEEAEIQRQLVLRYAPVRSQPGAQQRPKPFHGTLLHGPAHWRPGLGGRRRLRPDLTLDAHLAFQAEPGPPPPHSEAEAQGHELA